MANNINPLITQLLACTTAGEAKPEAYPQGYVAVFDEPRTTLADFFSMLKVLGQSLHSTNLAALLVALGSLSLLIGWLRLGRRLDATR